MNETVTYQWSKELAQASVRAFYHNRVGRLKFLIVAGTVIFVIGLFTYFVTKNSSGLTIAFIGGFFLLIMLVIHLSIRRIVRDTSRLIDDPTVTVTITDESISVSSQNSMRKLEWSRLSKVKESEGFLLLFAGSILFACLPVCRCQLFRNTNCNSSRRKWLLEETRYSRPFRWQ